MHYTATYSPEDNKLRLYASSRLDKETYERVRAAGFIWAPKQELFVAPAWSPSREDLLLELAGEIDDEDKSLVERQEERAERFEGYKEARAEDAEQARQAVHAIADGIPLGQPILVGHHSEKRARKDAERIENGMRRAVKMWETSQYWKDRAAGAIRHAKYKERPDVRARRIKTIEADKRKEERSREHALKCLKFWNGELEGVAMDGSGKTITFPVNHKSALWFTGRYDQFSMMFPADKYPRPAGVHVYEGYLSLWDALGGTDGPEHAFVTVEQARGLAIERHNQHIQISDRWISHYNNRLEYERAMLEEQGASELLKPKPRPEQLPLCNYRVAEGLDIPNVWRNGEPMHYPLLEMTQAEYAKIHNDYKGTRVVGNSHRVRTAMRSHSLYYIFLTDAKTHIPPAAVALQPKEPPQILAFSEAERPPEADAFEAMKDSLKAGVQVVSAPQLFPTPPDLAARMVELADIQANQRILEPSAGTGNLLTAILSVDPQPVLPITGYVVGVEVNHKLASLLAEQYPLTSIRCADFLECNGDLGKFDRVVMNPPFENASDVKHIKHALTMLRPGGRLVAICANGPRQQEQLKPLADTWEELPAGTFEGTGVHAALLVINA